MADPPLRVKRRVPGVVPYPLQYSPRLQDLDNWTRLFFNRFCQNGLTIYQPIQTPQKVLDIGCGSGSWVIDAALCWKDATFVGFDLPKTYHLQPTQLDSIPGYEHLASRISWQHGNLLDGLPFPSNSFDFVRMVNVGMGIPEDEWQNALEEIHRVLEPDGVLEIIEEDAIFPCGPKPPLSKLLVDLPMALSPPSALSTLSTNTSLTNTSTSSADKSPRLKARSYSRSENASNRRHRQSSASHPSLRRDFIDPNSQNHERLKAAYEAMLAARFISYQALSVIPFYIESIFEDVQKIPEFRVYLPPNSSQFTEKWQPFFLPNASHQPMETDNPLPDCPWAYWSPIHLSYKVETVKACKEAIWEEYELLYGGELCLPPITRTTRPKEIAAYSSEASPRECFERSWSNWENDMMDRMKFRTILKDELCISEPQGDTPTWRLWRDAIPNLDVKNTPEDTLCRVLRGFNGRKKREA